MIGILSGVRLWRGIALRFEICKAVVDEIKRKHCFYNVRDHGDGYIVFEPMKGRSILILDFMVPDVRLCFDDGYIYFDYADPEFLPKLLGAVDGQLDYLKKLGRKKWRKSPSLPWFEQSVTADQMAAAFPCLGFG